MFLLWSSAVNKNIEKLNPNSTSISKLQVIHLWSKSLFHLIISKPNMFLFGRRLPTPGFTSYTMHLDIQWMMYPCTKMWPMIIFFLLSHTPPTPPSSSISPHNHCSTARRHSKMRLRSHRCSLWNKWCCKRTSLRSFWRRTRRRGWGTRTVPRRLRSMSSLEGWQGISWQRWCGRLSF